MRKIENFAQISDLLNAQLKKGVITNNFLRGDDYTREIAKSRTDCTSTRQAAHCCCSANAATTL